MMTAGDNLLGFTGPVPGTGGVDPGDAGELAINYYSAYDPATNVYTQPYFRNFTIFNGKGGAYFKVTGNTYTIDVNVDNFNLSSFVKFRGPNPGTNGICTIQTTHTANRALTLPDVSGQLTTTGLVASQISAAAGTTPVPVNFVNTNYTMTSANCVVIVDAPDNLQTITLPAASTVVGRIFKISNSSSTTSFTLTSTSGLVQWLASRVIPPSTQLDVISDGSNYFFV
jgi:hypothetical protein